MSESPQATKPRFRLFDDSTPYTTIDCLKEEDLRSVWLLDITGRGLTTLKRWPINWSLRWKSLFRQSQPQRQITGAWRLLKVGVNTPQPATPVYRSGDFYQLEMPFIEGSTVYELFKSSRPDPASSRSLIARELGGIVCRLAHSHLRHRDLKLENVILKTSQTGQTQPSLWLIDPVGIRVCFSEEKSIACMLDRLAIQPLNAGLSIPLSLQIICIRSATAQLDPKRRKRCFQILRKRLQQSLTQISRP